MKKILLALMAVVTLVFSGCSAEDDDTDFQYEVPLNTLFETLDSQDSTNFLRCFATPVLNAYENSDDFDENLAQTYYSQIAQCCGAQNVSINKKITDKRELSGEELENIPILQNNRHKLKKAYNLTVRVTAFPVENRKESYSQEMQITVGKIGDIWYVCDSPVMDWNLIKDVKDI